MTNATVPPVSTFTGVFTATPVTSGEVERRLDMLFRVLFQNFQDGIDLRPFDADKKRHAFLFQKSAR